MEDRVKDALAKLVAGNDRFVKGVRSVESLGTAARRTELADKGQEPFACIIGCADSRSPAEHVFDCGLGDLFVCRVAGNVVNSWNIASVEFAALKLKTPVCVIMGHSQCGAVDAALTQSADIPSRHLRRLIEAVREGCGVDRPRALPPELKLEEMRKASWKNIETQCRTLLEHSRDLARLHNEGKFEVVGAYYDLRTGVVTFSDRLVKA